jgi:V8-like Glu-specific endopeptidase
VAVALAAVTAPAAAQSGDIDIDVADETIAGNGQTTFTIEITNTGSSQQKFTTAATSSPNNWNVKDNEPADVPPNNYRQVTLNAGETGTTDFTVVPDGDSETGSVTFGLWAPSNCGILGCDAKGTFLGSATDSVTVDGSPPDISNVRVSIDGRDATVRADVTDASAIQKVDVTYNPSGFLNAETIEMTRDFGDTFSATRQLAWDTSFEYDVSAEDTFGQSTETSDFSDSIPPVDPPAITSVSTDVEGRQVEVTTDVSAGSGSVDSVTVNWDTGGILSDLNPFSGSSTQIGSSAGTHSVTLPTSGTFSWDTNVKVGVEATGEFGNTVQSDQYTAEIPPNDAPTITNVEATIDGRDATVCADITDDQGISTADVTYNPSGFLNAKTIDMTNEFGDTYCATRQLAWDTSFEYDVYAEDPFGKSTETSDASETIPPADPPAITDVETTVNGRQVVVTTDVSAGSGSVDSVTVNWDTGGILSDLNPFSGSSTQIASSAGTHTVTLPTSGTFSWDTNVKVGVEATGEFGNTVQSDQYTAEIPPVDPPSITNVDATVNGRQVEVTTEVSAGSGSVDSVTVNWDTGGILNDLNPFSGSSTQIASSAGTHTVTLPTSGTFSWDTNVTVGVEATGEFGNTVQSDQYTAEIPPADPPVITDVTTTVIGQQIEVRTDVAAGSGSVDSVEVTWDTGGLLNDLNPFSGSSTQIGSSAGTHSVTIPTSGAFDPKTNVTVGVKATGEFGNTVQSDQYEEYIPPVDAGPTEIVTYDPDTGDTSTRTLSADSGPYPWADASLPDGLDASAYTAPPTDYTKEQITGESSQYPWSAVGALTAGSSAPFCSGSLIEDNHVITAAHCVYDSTSGGWTVSSFTRFKPGYTSGSAVDAADIASVQIHDQWRESATRNTNKNSANRTYDIAVLTLEQTVGAETGTFGYDAHARDSQEYKRNDTHVTGYPAAQTASYVTADGQLWDLMSDAEGTEIKLDSDPFDLDECFGTRLCHDLPTGGTFGELTRPGMSGGPVWVGDGPTLLSVFAAGPQNDSVANVILDGIGVRITEKKETMIGEMVAYGNENTLFAPVARLSASAETVQMGQEMSFDASGSTDPDAGTVETYRWDFDSDGSYEQSTDSPTVSYAFDRSGQQTMTVQVVDDEGQTATASATVQVTNQAPQASLAANPATIAEGNETTLTAADSTDADGSDAALSYSWQAVSAPAGASAPVPSGSGGSVTLATPGSYTYTVTVSDGDKQDTAEATVTVEDVNAPPVARLSATPTSLVNGTATTLDASGSSDPDDPATALTYTWRVASSPAGATAPTPAGASGAVTLTTPGTYTYEVTVSDGERSASAQVTLSVSESGPPAIIGNAVPQDPDGDGVYEDIRGDGTVDVLDVQALFNNLNNPLVQQNARYFDFPGGRTTVTVLDVQALFNDIPGDDGGNNTDDNTSDAPLTDAFVGESQGGLLAIGEQNLTAAERNGFALPPSQAVPEPLVVEGDIDGDTWESTNVTVPNLDPSVLLDRFGDVPISPEDVSIEITTPNGFEGTIDQQAGRLTVQGQLNLTVSLSGTPIRIPIAVDATTGQSGAMTGSADFGSTPVTATVVDNQATVPALDEDKFSLIGPVINDQLGLPSGEGETWVRLQFELTDR